MAKKDKEVKEETVDSVKLAAKAFYKNNKEHIYNDPDEPFKVSTGVFSIDEHLDGGISSGTLVRLLGPPTSGKSSEGLLIIKNFLEQRDRARGLIVPTESRLTEKLQNRSGVKFVDDPEEWDNKTCLILPMNIYEKIANFISSLLKTNEMKPKNERENFIFMVDCMDYLMLQSDLEEKEIGVARKVAGPQYLTKMMWTAIALPFGSGQHIFLAISQQSAAPKIDKYAKDPLRQGGSSGGTNVQYQASTVLDFSGRWESDYLLENPAINYDPKKNKKIGHAVKGHIRKGDNECYDVKFEYKVKYGRIGGNSVWTESDICDWLVAYSLLHKEGKGAWFNLRESIRKEMLEIDKECPEKFQGLNNFLNYLEEKPLVTKLLQTKMNDIQKNEDIQSAAEEVHLE